MLDFITTLLQGTKTLAELLLSEQAIHYFFYEGGWEVFLRGVLKGITEARYGIYF